METSSNSATLENRLSKISPGFKLFAKEELQKEINQLSLSPALDPDEIFVNILQGTKTSPETLTEALLKKSIQEENLLSHTSAGLYVHPESTDKKDQTKGLHIADIRNIVDRLSTTLMSTYYEKADSFWESNRISIPQGLQENPINNFLQALAKGSSLINKVYQCDSGYPNLKQTAVSYYSKKLKNLYNQDIHPDTVLVLLFSKGTENSGQPFLLLNLTSFIMNLFKCIRYSPENTTIQIEISHKPNKAPLSEIFQESDFLAIKSSYQAKLNLFWQNNTANYRILAKFSYLRSLLEQQNSIDKLSETGLKLAWQALGFTKTKIAELIQLDTIDPDQIPLDILEASVSPNQVEITSFSINNQVSSDILQICDPKTNDFLLYIPGYKPSFIEAKDERLLQYWIFYQTQFSQANSSAIASHFPHSSKMMIDVFLYQGYIAQEEKILPPTTQNDIFSFITLGQSSRTFIDLYTDETTAPQYSDSTLDYRSTDSAVFTTIAAAIEYVPCLFPNIHNTSSDLLELFPSPYQTASDLMKKGIKENLQLDVDPDKTFIRFSLHERGAVYYDSTMPPVSKGQEASTTVQSLTEAVLNNYRVNYSPFGYTTIIYQDSSGKGEYISSNQLLNILPQDVQEIVQQADLYTLHKNKLTTFWNTHTDTVKHFIKHRYLQQALEAYHNKTLPEESFKTVSEVVFYSLALEDEEAHSFINPNLRIEIISVDDYQSTDMFVFHDTSQQRVILYIAGNKEPFFSFATHAECICFLEENAKKNVPWQKMLTSHFSMGIQDSVRSSLQQGPCIPMLSLGTAFPLKTSADCSFKDPLVEHPITTKLITESLFTVILKNTQKRSYLDANLVITSDKELMLQRLITIAEAIEIALFIFSVPFPIVNWVALAALTTETALELYIAKNGDTVKERHQAAKAAESSAIECLLLGAFLSARYLKLSKSQSISLNTLQNEERLRPLTGGSDLSIDLQKSPVSQETFFNTQKRMHVWNIVDTSRRFKQLDVKAWFLDERFLLFTGKTEKANHLIISSHGGYFPGSGIVKVPSNTELAVLGPHGSALFDPRTANIAKKLTAPYGIINKNSALPTQTAVFPSLFSRSPNVHMHPIATTDIKLLAGTNVPGHIKNYSLGKYQGYGLGQENYLDLACIVNDSRHPAPNIYQIGVRPSDILTVRNRRGRFLPNLKDVFTSLERNGIHYDRITLEFCRSNMFASKSNFLPKYRPARIY